MPERDDTQPLIEAAGAGSPKIHLRTAGPRGLVAWIETHGDIDTLCVADHGRLLLKRSLARGDTLNFGYEGCHARYLAWHRDRVVVVSYESSHSYLRALDPDGAGELGMAFPGPWVIDGDLAIWGADYPGLLFTAALPSLDARRRCPFAASRRRSLFGLLKLRTAMPRAAFSS